VSKQIAKQKPWLCAIVEDRKGEILVGTNGTKLRIRRAGELPIELNLKNCQTTARKDMERALFDLDPLFHSIEKMESFMEERREEDAKAAEFRKKHGLRTAINEVMKK
jgi:hypothetical protein